MRPEKIKLIYKISSFILLALFLLFVLLIVFSVKSGQSPVSLLKSPFSSRNRTVEYIVPVSFYEEQSWIDNIEPNGNTISDLIGNSNSVNIKFAQDMDVSYIKMHSRHIYTEAGELEFSNVSWLNLKECMLTLNRTPLESEYIIIEYSFKDINGNILPKLVVHYE